MQTYKTRNESSEVSNKTSPVTPRSSNASKTMTTTKPSPTKITTERSPRITQRWSPKTPVIEKARSIKQSDLESQITQLQDELKKAKDELSSSESSKEQLQQEVDEAKKQLTLMSTKLEEAQSHLVDFAWSGDGLEVHQKQSLVDGNAREPATNEVYKLKQQFNVEAQLEGSDIVQDVSMPLKEAAAASAAGVLSTSEKHKDWIREGNVGEGTEFVVLLTHKQLEMTKTLIESLCAEGTNFLGTFNSSITKMGEPKESKVQVDVVEEMVKEHLACVDDQNSGKIKLTLEAGSGALHSELELLRAAFDAAEEHTHTALQICSSYNTADFVNVSSAMKESDLSSSVQKSTADFLELESRLVNMERELHAISEMNKELKEEMEKEKASQVDSELKLIRANMDLKELKAILLDKETELQAILDENEQLKSQDGLKGAEDQKNYAAAIADAERAKAAELEVLRRLGFLNTEAEKNSKMAARVMEQLETAQAVNSEMEAELRKLRLQSDQWRKAAETAAAMLAPGDNEVIERTTSVDAEYNSTTGKLTSSPFLDALDETSPKKKNNVLRKISGLWKKGSK